MMKASINTPLFLLNPKMTDLKQAVNFCIPELSLYRASFPFHLNCHPLAYGQRANYKTLPSICAISGMKEAEIPSSHIEDFSVVETCTENDKELKIRIEVSRAKTREIFDGVFDKMVAAAQPIPGFRRERGGKTPNIPRDILLEVLGPSKVYKQVIKSIINSAVAGYVHKNDLKVSKNLKVEQSYEDLEAAFEPGESFSFNAVVHLINSI